MTRVMTPRIWPRLGPVSMSSGWIVVVASDVDSSSPTSLLVCPAHTVTEESRRQEKLQKQKDLGDQEWLNLGLFMSTFLLENSIFPPHAPPRPLSLVGAFTSLVQQ